MIPLMGSKGRLFSILILVEVLTLSLFKMRNNFVYED